MTAVVLQLVAHRNRELVAALRSLLAHAERGEIGGFGGEVEDTEGHRITVLLGSYRKPGAATDLGFRLQMKAAFRSDTANTT
jgi:hypothetical protein